MTTKYTLLQRELLPHIFFVAIEVATSIYCAMFLPLIQRFFLPWQKPHPRGSNACELCARAWHRIARNIFIFNFFNIILNNTGQKLFTPGSPSGHNRLSGAIDLLCRAAWRNRGATLAGRDIATLADCQHGTLVAPNAVARQTCRTGSDGATRA